MAAPHLTRGRRACAVPPAEHAVAARGAAPAGLPRAARRGRPARLPRAARAHGHPLRRRGHHRAPARAIDPMPAADSMHALHSLINFCLSPGLMRITTLLCLLGTQKGLHQGVMMDAWHVFICMVANLSLFAHAPNMLNCTQRAAGVRVCAVRVGHRAQAAPAHQAPRVQRAGFPGGHRAGRRRQRRAGALPAGPQTSLVVMRLALLLCDC